MVAASQAPDEDARSPFDLYLSVGLVPIPLAPSSKQPNSSLLPIGERADGSIGPTWRLLQRRAPTQAEMVAWNLAWRAGTCQPGIVCGDTSYGAAVFDADDADFVVWCMTSPTARVLLQDTWVVRTGSGMLHIYLRSEAHCGTVVLTRAGRRLGELKAEGSYVCAPPSIHDETRQPYVTVFGGPDRIKTVPDAKVIFDLLADYYAKELGFGPTPTSAARVQVEKGVDTVQRVMPPVSKEEQDALRKRMRDQGINPKVIRAVRDGAIPKEGDWLHCDSHSHIQYAVAAALVEADWTDLDVEKVFASFPIGVYTYQRTDRPHHGWTHLKLAIDKARTDVKVRRSAGQEAHGQNFSVIEVLREEWPGAPIYKVRVVVPGRQIEGWIQLSPKELLNYRLFAEACSTWLGFGPNLKPEHVGKGYPIFADLLMAMAVSVAIPEQSTNIGMLKQKLSSLMWDPARESAKMHHGVPRIPEDFTLGWKDDDEGALYVHSPTLYARLSAAVKPTPQSKEYYAALRALGGEIRVIRYGSSEQYRAKVWRIPMEEVLEVLDE